MEHQAFRTPYSLVAQRLKRLPAMWDTRVLSLGREDPLEKEMASHSSILAGESHGWRSLVGYSQRGRKESDTTEQPHSLTYFLSQLKLTQLFECSMLYALHEMAKIHLSNYFHLELTHLTSYKEKY